MHNIDRSFIKVHMEYPTCNKQKIMVNTNKDSSRASFRVIFSYSVSNGGRLSYIDRDLYREPSLATPHNEVTLQGRTILREFTFHWDLKDPYHKCLQECGNNCTIPPVNAEDVSNLVCCFFSYVFNCYEFDPDRC